ncbi:HNH endonuclease [Streptococcus oricebi]|uniref:HNH endonuclease n=1 Tax=Streptococcus oricebi TaxID=1547447 RepID=A0ABS5B4V2_9STRE|nr:HNH endonuclease [Streptococcus oricebi]MBP2623014.1 HNH endonuclease [Streptococcus oricebi]
MINIRQLYKKDYRGYEKVPVRSDDITYQYSKESERSLLKETLIKDFKGQCVYCGWSCSSYTSEPFHIEHIKSQKNFPLERDNYKNLALACPICNKTKQEKELPKNLDPLSKEFSKLFYRNKSGAIVTNNALNEKQKRLAEECSSILGLHKELYKLDYIYSSLKKIQKELTSTHKDSELLSKICEIIMYIDENYVRSSGTLLK